MKNAKNDIIIISHNNSELTLNCLESVYQSDITADLNVIVVDNKSTDETEKKIREKYPEVKIILNEENFGYAKAVNIGFKNSNSEIVLVANNDLIFQKDTIEKLINFVKSDNKIGLAGGQQFFPDGKRQKSYGDLPGIKLALKDLFFWGAFAKLIGTNDESIREVPYVDGALIAIRRQAFVDLKGFDEDYFFYTEEADFCFRLKRAGWKVMFNPEISFIHLRGAASSGSRFSDDSIRLLASTKLLYSKKHHSEVQSFLWFYIEKINLCIRLALLKVFGIFSKNDKVEGKTEYFANMLKYWKR